VTYVSRSQLEGVGFTAEEAERRVALFDLVAARWSSVFGSTVPTLGYHVPGRIEVLGKHTDYAGGRSLVCATEQGLALLATPRSDQTLRILDARRHDTRVFDISADLESIRGDWGNYPMTVARRLATDFGPLTGADVAFASDLPFAAGVSSSSAIVVAVALLLVEINCLDRTAEYARSIRSPEDLGGYLGAVENGRAFRGFAAPAGGGVGTMGGSQDQTAILASRPDALSQYRFDPVALERVVPWPEEWIFAVAASGVVAEKTGAALAHYNDLARLTARLAELVPKRAEGRTLGGSLMDNAGAARAIADRLTSWPDRSEGSRLLARLTQLDGECRLVIPGVADALIKEDRLRLRELVAASQQGAALGLRNQVVETTTLVDLALHHGAIAASAFGAGFGGSVWAMIERADGAAFADRWKASYLTRFPGHADGATVFLTRPGPPATRLPI